VHGHGWTNSNFNCYSQDFSVGSYVLIVELEMPNNDLMGVDLKLKVSFQTSETYFMLSNKYNRCLTINDPRIQQIYKQVFSNIALKAEKRMYIGSKGELNKV